MSLKRMLNHNLKNMIGKNISRKAIVFESDDWGSIRMPSLQAYNKLTEHGLQLDKGDAGRYNQNDTLASAEDLEALFETLKSYKDKNGRHPVFTGLTLTSNPDFKAIKEEDFKKYISEPFTTTLKKYGREDAFTLWKQGIEEHLFIPEFHGREHLNVSSWMRQLQSGDRETKLAFDVGYWGFSNMKPEGISYQAAFALEYPEDLEGQGQIITEGLKLFEEMHGYRARFFVAPNGPVNNSLEKVLAEGGIEFMGASKIQKEPQGNGEFKKRFHKLGQINGYGQMYLTRNAFFEPNKSGQDWVSTCLEEIEAAFRWNKPAVISTHRTNYIGSLRKENRKEGLNKLSDLLKQILKRWPYVEFMTTSELGDLIRGTKVKAD